MNLCHRLIFALSLASGLLWAQASSGLSSGTTEVTGLIGVADGNFTFGGALGRAITEKIFVQGEVSRINGDSASTTTSAGTFKASASALNFNGTLHYNFTKVLGPKFVPYAAGGLGITHVSAKASGVSFSASSSDTRFYLNLGGGLRYYVKPNWGLRPEIMFFAGDNSYARFAVGAFYHF